MYPCSFFNVFSVIFVGIFVEFLRTLEAARQVTRTTPWVRFKFKVFCPECGKRVQPADVGEAQEMREVCQTMWRKFMQHLGPKKLKAFMEGIAVGGNSY